MAKPTEIPTWATDAGATNDPGASRKATGFVTGKKAPAKWFNHLFNRAGQWFLYLNALHSEPEFLNKAYAWTGQHSFPGGHVANDWGVQGEVVYVDAAGAPTPKTRTILLDVRRGQGEWENSTSTMEDQKSQTFPFPTLATGMVVTKITVSMRMGVAAASSNMFFRVRRNVPNPSGTLDIIDAAPVYHSGAAFGVSYVIVEHVANYPIDNAASWLELYARSADTASSAAVLPGNQIGWVKLEVSDLGPRND